jgi:hypothetical protein
VENESAVNLRDKLLQQRNIQVSIQQNPPLPQYPAGFIAIAGLSSPSPRNGEGLPKAREGITLFATVSLNCRRVPFHRGNQPEQPRK